MSFNKGKSGGKPSTGTVFFKSVQGKFGTTYTAGFSGVGEVTAEINGDGYLMLKIGETTDLIQPKSNDYGAYFVAPIGDKRYFLSLRENARGEYLMAMVAPERVAADGRTDRPASYGKRT